MEIENTHYKMDHIKLGVALIFNHEKFDFGDYLSRGGTQRDRDHLEGVLKTYSFDVRVLNDECLANITTVIDETARMDHSDHDCLLIAVLTHGQLGLLGAKDTHYSPELLWKKFTNEKCPTLANKPKIFIIQACQGDMLDSGVTLTNDTELIGNAVTDDKVKSVCSNDKSWFAFYINPPQADFLSLPE